MQRTLGVIGGSGLYGMEGLERVREIDPASLPGALAFGPPSDSLVEGFVGETRLVFIPRHGRGHRIPPHRVNSRANLLALKAAGVEQVVAVSAVGSLRDEVRPGDLVVVDQLLDRTSARPRTYFEDVGVVAHVGFAEPFDAALRAALADAIASVGSAFHDRGTYVCIEGPQFSTRAEAELHRRWGADVVGMTALPEARLARECELPYALLALVTDYDCWKHDEAAVSAEAVVGALARNVARARSVLRALAGRLPEPSASPASRALDGAVMTAREAIPSDARHKLGLILDRWLKTTSR